MFERCKDGFVSKIDSQSGIIFPDRADLRSVGTSAIGNGLLHIALATGLTEIQRETFRSSRSGAETVAIAAIARRGAAAASWDTFFIRSAELSTKLIWADRG